MPNAIVYCEGAFNTPNGKTAHGLVRFTARYNVVGVIDSRYRGQEAGLVLDGKSYDIPIFGSLQEAANASHMRGRPASHMVVGLAPDGGRMDPAVRRDIKRAITMGLNVDSGLHDFLSEDSEMSALAAKKGVILTDVRKPPPKSELHFFTGDIAKVNAFKIAVLGTDSAVGKRTTAWKLVEGFRQAGFTCEMIGTGQTAWMQGVRYGVIMDSLVNDFVAGEIEHAVYLAWVERRPDVIVIEGQGSLMNPAYPGGFEILAAARPDAIVLQHAPARKDYDGFPGHPIHPMRKQIQALELISDTKVVAVTINHEGIPKHQLPWVCATIERRIGLPTVDVLVDGPMKVIAALAPLAKKRVATARSAIKRKRGLLREKLAWITFR
ncbi:MAG: DUF1611 domain-containing protein [Candidatus Latescibacteria bacterium]|nr:DUF1611 domain-containing protein [Candidatus Latescibacterota bacterium]NIO55215.1 DUF1611 domain-containing protein [Candidatus Latescibacterota bacterium]